MAHSSLLGWLDAPDPVRGIRFALPDGSWDFWPYERLAGLAREIGAGLLAGGVRPGDVVSIVQRSGPHFVGTLFGAMAVGAVPSPVAPPLAFADRDVYRDHAAGLIRTARPAMVVTDEDLAETVAQLVAEIVGPDAAVIRPVGSLLGEPAEPGRIHRDPADLALLQFTSGSSGRSRGVRVSYPALAANVGAIRDWLAMTPGDPTASWLPVHHDMGLIGCLITPVVNGSDLWLLPPEEFVRNPLRYLRCFGADPGPGGPDRAVLTSMPNFGLGYIARRVPSEALEGLDFSRWRAVIVGAERIDAEVLERFCALLGPYGLDRRALLPAYGLAEATLAVTGLPLPERVRSTAVGEVEQVVGCGRALAGVHVSVVDEEGRPLPEGEVGEIVVGGASVALGYVDGAAGASLTSIVDGTLRTADAGVLRDGQLFVLGRLGDSLKLRGRALFAEDLELAMCQAGVPALRMAALLGHHRGEAHVVAMFEQPRPDWMSAADKILRHRTEGATIVIVDAPRGSIARTSSGKPKRRQLWRAFTEERLPGAVVPRPLVAGIPGGSND